MRKLIPFLTATILVSTVHAGQDCHYLNAHELSEEDISIMESVRPVRAGSIRHQLDLQPFETTPNKSSVERVCLRTIPTTDPQLSIEAGWDPVIKKVNCETGETLSGSQVQDAYQAG